MKYSYLAPKDKHFELLYVKFRRKIKKLQLKTHLREDHELEEAQ